MHSFLSLVSQIFSQEDGHVERECIIRSIVSHASSLADFIGPPYVSGGVICASDDSGLTIVVYLVYVAVQGRFVGIFRMHIHMCMIYVSFASKQ